MYNNFMFWSKKKKIIVGVTAILLLIGIITGIIIFINIANKKDNNKQEYKINKAEEIFICKKSTQENEYDMIDGLIIDNNNSIELSVIKQYTENSEKNLEIALNNEIKWKSLKPDIAVIDENGVLKPLKKGEALIQATALNGDVSAYCYLYINGIDLYEDSSFFYGDIDENGAITENDSKLLELYINGTIQLTDSQKEKADVTGDGEMKYDDYKIILDKVSNSKIVFPVLISSEREVGFNKTVDLKAFKYKNGEDNCVENGVTWISNNTNVATVDGKTGKITTYEQEGTAIITATGYIGDKLESSNFVINVVKIDEPKIIINEAEEIKEFYNNDVDLKIATSNENKYSVDYKIYYNDIQKEINSPKAELKFSDEGKYKIEARTIIKQQRKDNFEYQKSEVKTVEFSIDKTPPSKPLVFVMSGDKISSDVYKQKVQVKIIPSQDSETTVYTINNGRNITITDETVITLETDENNVNYSIEAVSIDQAGNESEKESLKITLQGITKQNQNNYYNTVNTYTNTTTINKNNTNSNILNKNNTLKIENNIINNNV